MIRLTYAEYFGRPGTGEWLFDHHEDAEQIGFTDASEAVKDALDRAHPEVPEKVVVYAFAREASPAVAVTVDWLKRLLEWLDQEYGDPYGGATKPSPTSTAVMTAAIRAVLANRTVWRCEQVAEIVVTREDLPDLWARATPPADPEADQGGAGPWEDQE